MQAFLRQILKNAARLVLGDYEPYYIYGWGRDNPIPALPEDRALTILPVDASILESVPVPLLQAQKGYFGPESLAFGCFVDGRLAGLCFYWFGERYRTRNFWPLQAGEAKLVQIIVLPELRGRGVASLLIKSSSGEMAQRGFGRLYARIWHSNLPSLSAFHRAGWRRMALVLEINPFRTARPIRITSRWLAKDRTGPALK